MYSPALDMQYSDSDDNLNLCTRAYKNFHSDVGCTDELSIRITMDDFITNTNLYTFNLTPDLNCCDDQLYINSSKQKTVSLRLTFKEATPHPISVLVLYESTASIEVTKSRQVLRILRSSTFLTL